MKIKFLHLVFEIILFLSFENALFCQKPLESNVLSYYASDNILIGQPFIERANILKFFPLPSYKDKTKKVTVAVSYGNNLFIRDAEKSTDGIVWEVLLPEFKLGDYITYIQFKTTIDTKELKESNDEIQKKILDLSTSIENLKQNNLKDIESQINGTKQQFTIFSDKIISLNNMATPTRKIDINQYKSGLLNEIEQLKEQIEETENDKENIQKQIGKIDSICQIIDSIYQKDYNGKINDFNDTVSMINTKLTTLNSDFVEKLRVLNNDLFNFTIKKIELESTLTKQFEEKVVGKITKNKISGPEVEMSDIAFKKDYSEIEITYRFNKFDGNYKPALDPAEYIGIFRIRYIPFPIVGQKLFRPFRENGATVFEIGLSFGSYIVSSNEYREGSFSMKRLGVAFAISEKLFSEDAEILALCLTYDFHSFASIGFGANFGKIDDDKKIRPYFSFGINKQAFESVIKYLTENLLGVNK